MDSSILSGLHLQGLERILFMVNKVPTCYCCYMLRCILTTSGMPKMEATNWRRFSKIYSLIGNPGYYRLGIWVGIMYFNIFSKCTAHMGGISQDAKRLKMWDFSLYSLGFLDHLHFFLLWWKLPCVWSTLKRVILCHVIANTEAKLSDFKLDKKLV